MTAKEIRTLNDQYETMFQKEFVKRAQFRFEKAPEEKLEENRIKLATLAYLIRFERRRRPFVRVIEEGSEYLFVEVGA